LYEKSPQGEKRKRRKGAAEFVYGRILQRKKEGRERKKRGGLGEGIEVVILDGGMQNSPHEGKRARKGAFFKRT